MRAVKAPGHNADMCVVTLDGGDGERGVFWADLVPDRGARALRPGSWATTSTR